MRAERRLERAQGSRRSVMLECTFHMPTLSRGGRERERGNSEVHRRIPGRTTSNDRIARLSRWNPLSIDVDTIHLPSSFSRRASQPGLITTRGTRLDQIHFRCGCPSPASSVQSSTPRATLSGPRTPSLHPLPSRSRQSIPPNPVATRPTATRLLHVRTTSTGSRKHTTGTGQVGVNTQPALD